MPEYDTLVWLILVTLNHTYPSMTVWLILVTLNHTYTSMTPQCDYLCGYQCSLIVFNVTIMTPSVTEFTYSQAHVPEYDTLASLLFFSLFLTLNHTYPSMTCQCDYLCDHNRFRSLPITLNWMHDHTDVTTHMTSPFSLNPQPHCAHRCDCQRLSMTTVCDCVWLSVTTCDH